MAQPDLSVYKKLPSGFFTKVDDNSGPYQWDGTNMVLQGVDDDTVLNPSATFARPGDTNAYAVDDLIANSTVAGSVAPMEFTVTNDEAGAVNICRARLRKSTNVVTNASFKLRLFSASPVASNGDNGVFLTDKSANYLGAIEFAAMLACSDGAAASGVPSVGASIGVKLAAGKKIYGLLQAAGAYAPGNAESFTVILECEEA